ncbi:MAG TPA: radical SAM protein [Vicinamibacteria bacterium]|nr:radical SAM protein [Vicinamibacteria bacterium]
MTSLVPGETLSLLSSRRLHLIVMPTEQCNFRCTYCYEDFELPRMRPEIVAGLEAFIRRRAPELHQLEVEWFGGEPLLAYDIVQRIQEVMMELKRRHQGLAVHSGMTTNAFFLDAEKLRRLTALGVRRYQVTLDGPEEVHDRHRVRADGGGTFATIWRNLVNAQSESCPFELVVRIHVTRENQDAVRLLLCECSRVFGRDRRFTFFVRPLSRLGGPNDMSLPVLDAEESLSTIAGLRDEAGSLGLARLGDASGGEGPNPVCYAAAANSFVVRANGELAKCTVALNDGRNRVGVLHEDGTVDIDGTKMAPWLRGLFSGDETELHCPKLAFADEPEPVSIML